MPSKHNSPAKFRKGRTGSARDHAVRRGVEVTFSLTMLVFIRLCSCVCCCSESRAELWTMAATWSPTNCRAETWTASLLLGRKAASSKACSASSRLDASSCTNELCFSLSLDDTMPSFSVLWTCWCLRKCRSLSLHESLASEIRLTYKFHHHRLTALL